MDEIRYKACPVFRFDGEAYNICFSIRDQYLPKVLSSCSLYFFWVDLI
jgi:hypothetical protein